MIRTADAYPLKIIAFGYRFTYAIKCGGDKMQSKKDKKYDFYAGFFSAFAIMGVIVAVLFLIMNG